MKIESGFLPKQIEEIMLLAAPPAPSIRIFFLLISISFTYRSFKKPGPSVDSANIPPSLVISVLADINLLTAVAAVSTYLMQLSLCGTVIFNPLPPFAKNSFIKSPNSASSISYLS